MIEYVIVGTSHCVQENQELESIVISAIERHAIKLVAEEYPCDSASRISLMAKRLHIPYLQIDLFPEEWAVHGIDTEMNRRASALSLQEEDYRLAHADAVREDFWLDKIGKSVEHGRVLVVCGYLHLPFLAGNIRKRGDRVLEESTFPTLLVGRTPTKILTQIELEEYLNEHKKAQ